MLSKLSTLILGFLEKEEHNPYEIIKLLQNFETSQWFPIGDSTVYANINNLKRKKLIVGRIVKQGKLPSKTIYKITELGKEELLKTIIESFKLPHSESTRYEVSLLLMEHLSKTEIMAKLKTNIHELETNYFELKKKILNIEQNKRNFSIGTLSVLKHRSHLIEAERKTINEIMKLLNVRSSRKKTDSFDFRHNS